MGYGGFYQVPSYFIMWYEMCEGCTRNIRIPVMHAEKYWLVLGIYGDVDAHRWLWHTTIIDNHAKAHVRVIFVSLYLHFAWSLRGLTVKLPHPLIFLQRRRGIIYIFLRSEGQRPLKGLRGHKIMIHRYCFWLFIHANVALKRFTVMQRRRSNLFAVSNYIIIWFTIAHASVINSTLRPTF